MQPFTITLALLVELEACSDQRDAFASAFPDGLTLDSSEPDEATVDRILGAKLDVGWFARRVLTAPAEAEYDRATAPAEAEYRRVTTAAWAEYDRVTTAAEAEYDRATAPAEAEYERVRAAAWAEYARVEAPALAEYARVRAAAWAEYERVRVRCLWSLLAKPENRRLPC